jgi:hypothetical protein
MTDSDQRSSVAKAIAALQECSLTEIAAALAALADSSSIDDYERLRRSSLDLLRLPRGRPPVCDDSRSLGEMGRLLENNEARSVEHAATLVAQTLTGQHYADGAQPRLAKKYRRLISGQNTDLNLRRGSTEADIKNASQEESSC